MDLILETVRARWGFARLPDGRIAVAFKKARPDGGLEFDQDRVE
ncbi:MAG TPA: hypothetical protein VGK61_03785 [Planctomycetota bacterium]